MAVVILLNLDMFQEKKGVFVTKYVSSYWQYFKEIYIDKNAKKPIELSNKVKHNLKSKANKLISLYTRKGIKLMFTDVDKILQALNVI